jgi:hypothetical protein
MVADLTCTYIERFLGRSGLVRRRTALKVLTPLVALSLIGAGCGGGDDKSTGSGSTGASSSDPAAILGAIKATDQAKPAKISLDMGMTLNGQITNPQVAAIVGTGPISVKMSGPSDPSTNTYDITFDVKAGKIALPGQIRVIDGTKAFLGLQGKWYTAPTSMLSGTTGQVATDPAKTLEALGNPAELLENATVVGGETIEGIDTDHVAGDINVAGMIAAFQRISESQGSSADAPSAEDIAQLKEALKSGKVDLWIGKETKQLHRMKLDVDVAFPAELQQQAMGVTGAKVALSVQSTPVDSVSVEAPSNPLPESQLQTDLLTILMGSLGSGTP